MKKVILLLFMICAVIVPSHAQYSSYNSFIRQALVSYHLGSDGYYKRDTNTMLDNVSNVLENYAYDKSAKNLYVLTPTGNVVITLNKDYAKIIKKNKAIPQFSGNELNAKIQEYTKKLDDKYTELNRQRTQHIQDSIAKAKEDSIQRVMAIARAKEAKRKADEDYRNTHSWRWAPVNSQSMNCTICDESISVSDSLFCMGIKNDSIYYVTSKDGDLDLRQIECHASKIPSSLATYQPFVHHYEIFKDSLTRDSLDYQDFTGYMNYSYGAEYLNKIRSIAPYGYFDGWGWDSEYSMVSFHFSYVNTNPKTIRYITVYFKITNDVGDICRTGYFKGVGPLKQWESANWSWDSSSYFVSGDASNMNITKAVITYMNGKTQVVSGRYLQFNGDD